MSAGCLFTDGKYVLCGLQRHGERSFISGFGGKVEGEESKILCAIRETFEELFNIKEVPQALIDDVFRSYIPGQIIENGTYTIYVYTFWELDDFLSIARYYALESPLYPRPPRSLQDLLFSRKSSEDSEILELALLPLSQQPYTVSNAFLSDLQLVAEKLVTK